MSHILITGFTPFDGRSKNASWIAAKGLSRMHGTKHVLHPLCLPVLWGQPRKLITTAVNRWKPRIIISLGEGKPGGFTLEAMARNTRSERPDNAGRLPHGEPIEPAGKSIIPSSAPLASIAQALQADGINIDISEDAGAYLCEELLYSLERIKSCSSHLDLVIFAHVPPFGTDLHYRGSTRQCDSALLDDFTCALLNAVLQQSF